MFVFPASVRRDLNKQCFCKRGILARSREQGPRFLRREPGKETQINQTWPSFVRLADKLRQKVILILINLANKLK